VPEDIGGFFAILRMQTDDASFAKAGSALTGVANIIKGFALLKVGEGMIQLLSAMGKLNEQQALLNTTSAQIGISTMELKSWQLMADMVGGSADSMAASLKGLMDITANLGRGITPDNQKFIDMLGVLGVTKWQGVSPTDLAKNMLDNAMSKIKQYRERGDKVGEARIRNAIDAMLGPSGNALLTAGITTGVSTQQLLTRAQSPLMTTQGQIQGAIGPMMDLKLFNSTIKEAENLFAMKFMAKVDPSLKDFLTYFHDNKDSIIQGLSDLASLLGTVTSGILGFLRSISDIGIFIDKLTKGKVDQGVIADYSETWAKILLPKQYEESKREYMARQRQHELVGKFPGAVMGTGMERPLRIIVEDRTSAGVKARGMEQIRQGSQRLQEGGR